MNNSVINTDKKTGIVYRKWQSGSTRAVFLLIHGLGAYSLRWDFLAQFFLKHSISSYAIDLKGFGETTTLKGHIDSFQTYYNDIQSLLSVIKKEHGTTKVFLIGESMGGLIAFIYAALMPALSGGLVCISPVFKSRLKFTLSDYAKIFFSLVFCPEKKFVMPFDAKMCTSDEDCQKLVEDNKSEYRMVSSKLLFNILLEQIRVHVLKPEIKIPVLFLISGEDDIADAKTAEKVFKKLRSPDKHIVCYAQMRHALSIERERKKVFEDILTWVDSRA